MKEYIYHKNETYHKNKIADNRISRIALLLLILASMTLLFQLHMEDYFRIYDNTLRFHIRAASDEAFEQELKLRVRDAVLKDIKRKVGQVKDASYIKDSSHMEAYLKKNQEYIENTAEECLKKYGCDREVKIFFTKERFPIRHYDAIIFPAGVYHAMRIDIGAAKGHNWWCALYPELCYNKEEFTLSEKGEREIRESLSKLEQKLLTGRPVRWGSKIISSIEDMMGKVFSD